MTLSFHPLRRLLLAALSALIVSPALADVYPSRTITLVVPAPPGGPADILARLYGTKIADSWKTTVIVDNKPGAAGSIGANQVAKAAPDGYTVLITIPALVQQMTLMKLPYDPLKDFQPVSRLAGFPLLLVVPKDTSASNLKEFIALVKPNARAFSIGNVGPGSTSQVAGALFNMQTGLDMVSVPYKGAAPLMTDLIGGQVKSAFSESVSVKPQMGKLKVLSVTGTERLTWLPDVPTLKEQGFHSFDPLLWIGAFMPAGTPKAVVDKFSAEIQRIAQLPEIVERLDGMGLMKGGDSANKFTETVKSDAAIYARIIKDANIKLD